MTIPESPPRIAYLTGQYPAVSHTFILREVEALRAAGVCVQTCSIRQTPPEQHRGPSEVDAAANTFYVLAAAKKPLTLIAAQLAALARPSAYFSALALAWHTRSPGMRAGLYQFFYFVEATILARHLRAQNITHLHNHFAASSATVSMLTAKLANIPFSFTLHGPADLEEPKRWRLNEKIARAKFVACISHFARSQAMLHSDPIHWGKLRIIHCGVTPELYAKNAGNTRTGKRFIFVGRLAAVKGLPVLIQAFAKALKSDPDLHLTLVGDGDDRAALETAAAPLGQAIRFTGYQSQAEVAEILSQSDVLVLPSFAEGVPVVLMEAMASAKPVIATRVAGVAELVEDGISGYLVTPGDPEALADKILHFSSDKAERDKMGKAGREKVCAEFDITCEAERLAALFLGQGGTALRPEAKAP